jgi:hypothetical protein
MMHGGSCGGYGTKACVIADSAGRAVVFALAPGQSHGLPHYVALLARLPGVSMPADDLLGVEKGHRILD